MTIEFNIARGKLQHLFKHAVDFGVTGHWNNQTAEAFEETIHNHINNPQVETIEGMYRGIVEVTHFFDPTTNLWAAIDTHGYLVAAWKLYPSQVQDLRHSGNVT
jgi:Colicin D